MISDELGIYEELPAAGPTGESRKVVDHHRARPTPGTYDIYCDTCCGGKDSPTMHGTLTVDGLIDEHLPRPRPRGVPPGGAGLPQPASRLLLGFPRPALGLAVALGVVALVSFGWILVSPFDAAAFGGLTVPIVLASGVADGLNPCAFALLVLFATYTLTLVNAVTADGTATARGASSAPRRGLALRRRGLGDLLHHRPRAVQLPRLARPGPPRGPGRRGPRPASWPCGCSRTCSCRAGDRR